MAKDKNGDSAVNTSSASVFTVLRHISTTQRPLGVAELHRITGEPISSTHRALMTLEEAGFVARFGPTTKFGPGPMVHHLIRALIARFPVRTHGLQLLKEIVDVTDSAATLHVRIGWFSLRVGWAEGRREFFQQRRIGETRLLHTDIAPLSMLATFPEKMLSAYRSDMSRRWPAEAETLRRPAFERVLQQARRDGYAVGADAVREERSWVARPVLAADGVAAASVAFAIRDDDIPNGSRTPELFSRITNLVDEFQTRIDRHPEEIAHPYDNIDPSEIRLEATHLLDE